ncbi:hypothetical protein I302_108784 [Kwoniella bestiolae CBS 10118]|uniref:Uncharacterized protein n=1 Tax=Kwoniella bestiolae CBS 10118 TaxID=1296100 RepID=A0A1B9FU30_9TREE|nr:hypothetical protein I302_07921 [Kwoniella bestiolae CBS 10118]OCF22276.1 hypothetical protein I302_07921 [Kwoniella bestiolae CBS 10118]
MPYRAYPPAQLVPYDPRQEGLYMVAGKGDGSPRKVVAYYQSNQDPRYGQYDRRRQYSSSESSWNSSSNWTGSSSTAKSGRGLFYNALANLRERFYGNMYPEYNRYPRQRTRYIPRSRSYSESSEDYWNRSGSESSLSSVPSCYTCSSSSEISLPARYRVRPEYLYAGRHRGHRHARYPEARYVRERGFWERIFGW